MKEKPIKWEYEVIYKPTGKVVFETNNLTAAMGWIQQKPDPENYKVW